MLGTPYGNSSLEPIILTAHIYQARVKKEMMMGTNLCWVPTPLHLMSKYVYETTDIRKDKYYSWNKAADGWHSIMPPFVSGDVWSTSMDGGGETPVTSTH